MTELALKAAAACHFDAVALGEVMLRFDPGEFRIHTARSFGVFEGGGEYNVARGLRRCFGLRTAIVTAQKATASSPNVRPGHLSLILLTVHGEASGVRKYGGCSTSSRGS